MAQEILPRWKSDLSSLFSRSNTQGDIRPLSSDVDYRISLDISHFGSPLPVQDILLNLPKTLETENQGSDAAVVSQAGGALLPAGSPPTEYETFTAASTQLPYQILPAIEDPEGNARSSLSSTDSTSIVRLVPTNIEPLVDPSTKQCIVCMEARPFDRFPPGKVTEYCHHLSHTCFTCLEYSIASDHRSKMWDNISCPQCYARLSYHDVKKYADPDTFAHYDSLCNREALSNVPNFIWCLGCDAGQIHEDGESCPAVTCQGCNAVSCFNHKVPWHEGLTCDQYDRLLIGSRFSTLRSVLSSEGHSFVTSINKQWSTTRLVLAPRLHLPSKFSYQAAKAQSTPTSEYTTSASDLGSVMTEVKLDPIAKIQEQYREQRASIRRIKQVCKRCPGPGCNWPIQKVDGCKHMTCLKCSFEFCWRCRRSWSYSHKCWKWW